MYVENIWSKTKEIFMFYYLKQGYNEGVIDMIIQNTTIQETRPI